MPLEGIVIVRMKAHLAVFLKANAEATFYLLRRGTSTNKILARPWVGFGMTDIPDPFCSINLRSLYVGIATRFISNTLAAGLEQFEWNAGRTGMQFQCLRHEAGCDEYRRQ